MKKHFFTRIIALIAFFIVVTAFMLPLNQEKKSYDGEKFSKLGIAVKSKVYIEQGDHYKLDIQADQETLENISVEYKTDELQIRSKPGSRLSEPVTIYITVVSLEEVSLAGSSDLFIERTFKTGELDLNVAGSGSMILNDLQAEGVSLSIAGSGNILLAGGKGSSTEKISIAGSGKIDALGFKAAAAKVEIAGSGDCKLFASEKLDVSIAGSGDVYYKGNPVIKSESAGSGKVSSLDK